MTTAFEVGNGLCLTFEAGEDLSAAQYHFVELNADGEIELCDAATDLPIGVLQDNPASGEYGNVMIMGVTKLEVERASAGSAVNEGDMIGTGSNGRADSKGAFSTTIANNTNRAVGRALTAAGAANSRRLIAAAINCATPVVTAA
ncbi:MAG: DUF2190 family protein [Gammaproteobacteria bacterium]|nr:DUF2190 family protein [Gammaproteobacteria bacterium]